MQTTIPARNYYDSTVYEVVCGGESQTVPTLGEASIIAHELSGAA